VVALACRLLQDARMPVSQDPRRPSEHDIGETILRTAEYAFKLPEPSHSRWHRAGVTPRAERVFEVVSGIVLSLFVLGWSWSIAAGRSDRAAGGAVTPVTASITAALTDPAATSTAYLTDALLRAVTPLRGESGRLRVALRQPGDTLLADTLPAGAAVRFESGVYAQLNDSVVAPRQPGVWGVAIQVGQAIKPVADFSLITLRPFSEKRRGRIGLYFIGSWPGERGRAGARGAQYANPEGFIEVTPDGDEKTALKAVETDQISAYPEYTGTALLSFFGVTADKIPTDPAEAATQAQEGFAEDGLKAFDPTPFTSSNEVAVTKETADELGLQTISDLSEHASKLTLYGSPECRRRLDCLAGLEQVYGLKFKKFVPTDIANRHEVLTSGRADVSIVFTTDPQIKREGFVLLEDDKGMFPPYNSMLVMKQETADEAGADLETTINLIQEGLTDEAMQELNARVDLDKKDPAQVATEYLTESGYIAE
jgi:osmoprotectant transport system substrate-binding protein